MPIVSGANLPVVNVLSWWGYLDNPQVTKLVQTTCHANLSYDEYYSNAEFLRRFNHEKQNYDVIIFSNTIYGLVKNQIGVTNSNLWRQSDAYNKIVRQHYLASKYSPNIDYFELSVNGFLSNPKNISVLPSNDLTSIFNKAGKNTVIIVDDPVEVAKLIALAMNKDPNASITSSLTLANFVKIIQGNNVYITNEQDSSLYNNPNFAVSFNWSGDAMNILKNNNNSYVFLIHPKLSYITADLLAQLNNKPAVGCVASVLSSRKVLNIVQNQDFYFSPYVDTSKVTDPQFKLIYKKFVAMLPTLSWDDTVSAKEYAQLNNTWKRIKIYLAKQSDS